MGCRVDGLWGSLLREPCHRRHATTLPPHCRRGVPAGLPPQPPRPSPILVPFNRPRGGGQEVGAAATCEAAELTGAGRRLHQVLKLDLQLGMRGIPCLFLRGQVRGSVAGNADK